MSRTEYNDDDPDIIDGNDFLDVEEKQGRDAERARHKERELEIIRKKDASRVVLDMLHEMGVARKQGQESSGSESRLGLCSELIAAFLAGEHTLPWGMRVKGLFDGINELPVVSSLCEPPGSQAAACSSSQHGYAACTARRSLIHEALDQEGDCLIYALDGIIYSTVHRVAMWYAELPEDNHEDRDAAKVGNQPQRAVAALDDECRHKLPMHCVP